MDKARALCMHTNAQTDTMHAVSKGFAWHVIRHLLNVTTCACIYLLQKGKNGFFPLCCKCAVIDFII